LNNYSGEKTTRLSIAIRFAHLKATDKGYVNSQVYPAIYQKLAEAIPIQQLNTIHRKITQPWFYPGRIILTIRKIFFNKKGRIFLE